MEVQEGTENKNASLNKLLPTQSKVTENKKEVTNTNQTKLQSDGELKNKNVRLRFLLT